MKLGKAIVLAASAAAAVTAAVYVKKKVERECAPLRKEIDEENWVNTSENGFTATIKKEASAEKHREIISDKITEGISKVSKIDVEDKENSLHQSNEPSAFFEIDSKKAVEFEDVFEHFQSLVAAELPTATVEKTEISTAKNEDISINSAAEEKEIAAEPKEKTEVKIEPVVNFTSSADENVAVKPQVAMEIAEKTEGNQALPKPVEMQIKAEDNEAENIEEANIETEITAESVAEQIKDLIEPEHSAEGQAMEILQEPTVAATERSEENIDKHQLIKSAEEIINKTVDEIISNEKTVDFFDLPDESADENKTEINFSSMEELFGNLLVEEKKEPAPVINNPNEIFSLYSENEQENDFDSHKDQKIEEEFEKKKTNETRRAIAQNVVDNISSFARLLEPLNLLKENKIKVKDGIMFDWEMTIQSLVGDLPIKTYWRRNFNNYQLWNDEKYISKCGELLSMLELAGIVRDNSKEVIVGPDTMQFYTAQSAHLNNDFQVGETAVVVRPCWRVLGKPAVMGEIAKKTSFADFSSKQMSPLEQMLRANKCHDGDYNIPVSEENFALSDRDIPIIKEAIKTGVCKCAVRRMDDGSALAFFYEIITAGDSACYPECTLRFEIVLNKAGKLNGIFKSEKV